MSEDISYRIECSWQNEGRILINPDGQVWPCCYLCNVAFRWKTEDKIEEKFNKNNPKFNIFNEYFDKQDELNLKNNSMEDILNHEWYTKTLPESWEQDETTSYQCKKFCGVKNEE